MKQKWIQKNTSLVLGTFLAASAGAGTFEVIGEGSSKSKAEFLKLSIGITGECFSSSVDARRQVEELARKAQEILESERDNTVQGQLQVFPGANDQAEKVRHVNGQTVVVCGLQNGWRSRSSIIFKLTNLDRLDEVQDAVLGLNNGLRRDGLESLAVTLSAPTPSVFETTYDAMVDGALEKAYNNALRQVNILLRQVPGQTATLSRVVPTMESSGQVSYDRTAMASDPSGESLGSVNVSVSRKFVFKTENSAQ